MVDQRPGDGYPLLLAAGKLVDVAPLKPFEVDQLQHLPHPLFAPDSGILRNFRPNSTFSYTFKCGNKAYR